jgi:hypothetical protein
MRVTIDLSEQFFFWACKQRDGGPGEDGTSYSAASEVLEENGACLESTWPYNPDPTSDPAQGPPPKGTVGEAKWYTFDDIDYYGYGYMDIDALKDSLGEGHIIVCGIPIFRSWYENPEVRRSGEVKMPLREDEFVGGHCINLVGYKGDESYPGGGYFILRNSWGEEWAYDGQYGGGYGTIPYAYTCYYWCGGWIAS